MKTSNAGIADDFTFGDPTGGGDMFKAADHLGNLVAFVEPTWEEDVSTSHGPADVAKVRYAVVLDGPEAGSVYESTMIFGKALAPAVYSNGEHAIVLGRIGQSEAKPGQNPAWTLIESTDADKQAAGAWFSANASRNAAGRIVIA